MLDTGTQAVIRAPAASADADSLRREVLLGLQRDPKELPCKLFYDERGSALFERICELDEYYLTRTEISILDQHAAEMAAAMGPRVVLIEFGSGNSTKTRLLLDRLADPVAYVPIDLSGEQLLRSAAVVASTHPGLEVRPLVADYTRELPLPEISRSYQRRVGFFPGSTVGNFLPEQTVTFLGQLRGLLGPDGGLLIGIDLKKDPGLLHQAYNDRAGVTAEFNLNLLAHLNRRFGADFRLNCFAHQAHYDPRLGRIEMHLISRVDQAVHLGELTVVLHAGERILTEVSYKYTPDEFAGLARRAGFEAAQSWTDPRQYFCVLWLTPS
jgi:dimethylhistidine N-methyltransferase